MLASKKEDQERQPAGVKTLLRQDASMLLFKNNVSRDSILSGCTAMTHGEVYEAILHKEQKLLFKERMCRPRFI